VARACGRRYAPSRNFIGQLQRFVIVDNNGYVVICLHSVLAYSWELFFKLPILRLKSPVKRCGKSTLLDVIERLALRPLLTVSVSPAGLFRIIECFHPYIMVDEADTFGAENDELRTIVNGGFERGRPAIRVNKETLQPEFFDTFCPKVLASIGGLHETIEDRSIIVNMKRKPPGVDVEELCDCDPTVFVNLRRKLQRWALDNRDAIQATKLVRPKALLDRAWNKWRPLLTIAHVVGGKWPDMCLKAALDIAGESDDERSIGVDVLARIRAAFKEKADEILFSKKDKKNLFPTLEILNHLNSDNEAPWADWKKGDKEGITAEKLSRILKPFKIKSDRPQINNTRIRGYWVEDFKDAFESYLPPEDINNTQEN
jgi:putative DNA primase/helicase